MKLATVSGACSGKSVQVMLPAVVSMMAVGSFGWVGGSLGSLFGIRVLRRCGTASRGLGSRQAGQAET